MMGSRCIAGFALLLSLVGAAGCNHSHDGGFGNETLSSTTAANNASNPTRVTDGSDFQIAVFVDDNGISVSGASVTFSATSGVVLTEVGNPLNFGTTITVFSNAVGQATVQVASPNNAAQPFSVTATSPAANNSLDFSFETD
ncbi:MAG TPA: hypothetical protein VFF73_36420 [Planctomycetota bacterium]|nr:hypothetical protein [Planctomycetota bacterium]